MNYIASQFFFYIIDFNVNDSPLSTDIRQNEKYKKNRMNVKKCKNVQNRDMNRYRKPSRNRKSETENFRSPLKSVKTCKTEISTKKIFIRFELMPTDFKK